MTTSYATAAPFDIGRVVGRSFSSIGRNFATFSLLALILVGVPAFAFGGIVALGATTNTPARATPAENTGTPSDLIVGLSLLAFVYLLTVFAARALQAAIVHGTVADLNGRRAGFGECFATGVRHAGWLMLITLVATPIRWLGYLLFFIPGVFVATLWIVAAPVQVVERTGVFGSLARSGQLTEGHRFPILGLLLIFTLGKWMVWFTLIGVGSGLAADGPPVVSAILVWGLLQPLSTIAAALIGAAGVASIYYELRSIREGVGPEQLAAVFD